MLLCIYFFLSHYVAKVELWLRQWLLGLEKSGRTLSHTPNNVFWELCIFCIDQCLKRLLITKLLVRTPLRIIWTWFFTVLMGIFILVVISYSSFSVKWSSQLLLHDSMHWWWHNTYKVNHVNGYITYRPVIKSLIGCIKKFLTKLNGASVSTTRHYASLDVVN